MSRALLNRTSTKQMGRGNMRRALRRIEAELLALVAEAPPGEPGNVTPGSFFPDIQEGRRDDAKQAITEAIRIIDGLWS